MYDIPLNVRIRSRSYGGRGFFFLLPFVLFTILSERQRLHASNNVATINTPGITIFYISPNNSEQNITRPPSRLCTDISGYMIHLPVVYVRCTT